MPYTVIVSKSVQKDIEALPKKYREEVKEKIKLLESDPYPHKCKKLAKQKENRWRIRVADYRIVYTIYNNELIIEVVTVQHRNRVYNDL